MPPFELEPSVLHRWVLEALGCTSIDCSECGATLFRLVDQSDYICERCGLIL